MKTWEVEVRGEAREIYMVQAETAEEAMLNWAEGELVMGAEVSDCGAVASWEVDA